ncbi:MAG: hypothetical protein KJ060_13770 [Candidatus Hydrogenedentes bacterium]|nr:hypothetical protein [Candidatus Hydrogenedentota bacterium]
MGTKLPRGPAIRALLWEDWRRSRAAFLVVVAIGLGLSLTGFVVTSYLKFKGVYTSGPDEEVYALAAWPVFFFGLVLVFSLSDPKDLTPRIPARHYTLPLSPRKVALVHLLFRLVSMGVLMALLSSLIQLALLSFTPLHILGAAAIAMAGFLVVQCLAWTVGNFGGWPFLASLVVLPIVLNLAHAGSRLERVLETAESYGVPWVVPVLVLLLGIGWIAIEGARWGRSVGTSPLRFDNLRTESPFFLRAKDMSPLSAQIAYEWQRKGRMLPALTMGFVALGTFFYVVFADVSVPRNRFGALGLAMLLFPVYAAPIAAIVAGVLALLDDYRQRISGVGTFLYTRAADSGLHSRARLIMSLKSVGITLGSCLIVMGIGTIVMAVVRPESLRQLQGEFAPFSVWGIAMMLAGYILMVWTLYWMAIPGAILWFWIVLVTIGFEVVNDVHHPFFEFLIIWPPSLAMIGATIVVAWRNAKNKMLFPWAAAFALFTAISVWCVVSWLGIAGSAWSSTISHFGLLTVIAAVFALSLCPAFPILAQPLLVERLRRS